MLYIFTVMEAVIFTMFFCMMLPPNHTGKKAVIETVVGTAALSAVTVLISSSDTWIKAIITIAATFVFCILVFKTQAITAFIITTLACYELTVCDIIVANLMAIATQSTLLSVVATDSAIFPILGVLSKLFTLAVVFISGKFLKRVDFTAPFKHSLILGGILLLMFYTTLFFAQTDTAVVTIFEHWEVIVLCTAYMLVTLLIFVLFFDLCRYFSTETELGYSKLKNNFLEQQLAQSKMAEQNIRSFRHDMMGHLSALAYLHKKGDDKRFDDYMNSISEKISVPFRRTITGIPMLDAVLEMTSRSAENRGIKININVSGVRHCPEVTENSLCSIFSNLLENAVEALGGFPDGTDKTVTADISEGAGCLTVRISNPYVKGMRKRFSASGRNHIHSGLGLGIARRTVIENGGMFEYGRKDGIFTVIVMLPVGSRKIAQP